MLIYFVRNKFEVFGIFKKFKAIVKLSGCSLKKLRTNREWEFTFAYTSQHNGVVERKSKTIVEMARSMLHEKGLLYKLWGEAVKTTVYLLNRCPTRVLENVTPFEMYSGRKPEIKQLRIFGLIFYSLILSALRHKLEEWSIKGIFIGYGSSEKGYKILNPLTMKVMVFRDVIFDENGNGTGKRTKSMKFVFL